MINGSIQKGYQLVYRLLSSQWEEKKGEGRAEEKTKFAKLPELRYNEDWEGYAGVAEPGDALDSKSSGAYPPMWVRSPPPALFMEWFRLS